MKRTILLVIGAASVLMLIGAGSAYAAPANDNYASAQTVAAMNTNVDGDNTSASLQASEIVPNNADAGIGASVWYSWTAPSSETVQIHTCGGADLDTVIGVYTASGGSPPASGLTEVESNDQGCSSASSWVQFSAVAATAYKIQVSGYDNGSGPATGPFTLRVSDVFPQTIIDSGPGATSDSTPTWAFHSTVAGSAFTCVVYTLPAFDVTDSAGCISTYTAPTLALGSYEFDVYSQGPGGEFSLDSAARAFTVGAAPLPPPLPPPTPTPPHKKKCKKKAKKASAAKKKCKKKK